MKKKSFGKPYAIIAFGIIVLAVIFFTLTKSPSGPRIYVANEGDGTVSVIDEQSFKVIATIKLAGMPHNVNVDPLGRYAYATNHEEGPGEETGEMGEMMHGGMMHVPYLRVIDIKTSKVVASVPMAQMAAHAVPSRDGKFVYVSREGGSTIVEVDLFNFERKRTFSVGEGPHGFVLSNDGKTIYSPNKNSNDASILDIATGAERRINLSLNGNSCETPAAMGITRDDKYSFVTCAKSFDIFKIDNTAERAVARVQLEKGEYPGPIQVPAHPNGKHLFVPDMRNGVVHKIDIERFILLKDIPTGKGAHGIAYSADGKRAYVTNTWDHTLSMIDLETDTVLKTIAVGEEPNGVAIIGGKNQGW